MRHLLWILPILVLAFAFFLSSGWRDDGQGQFAEPEDGAELIGAESKSPTRASGTSTGVASVTSLDDTDPSREPSSKDTVRVVGTIEFVDDEGTVVEIERGELRIRSRSEGADDGFQVPFQSGRFAFDFPADREMVEFESAWDGNFRLDEDKGDSLSLEEALGGRVRLRWTLAPLFVTRVVDEITGLDLPEIAIYDGEPCFLVDSNGVDRSSAALLRAASPFKRREGRHHDSQFFVSAPGYAPSPLSVHISFGHLMTVLDTEPTIALQRAGSIDLTIVTDWEFLTRHSKLKLICRNFLSRIEIDLADASLNRLILSGLSPGSHSLSIERSLPDKDDGAWHFDNSESLADAVVDVLAEQRTNCTLTFDSKILGVATVDVALVLEVQPDLLFYCAISTFRLRSFEAVSMRHCWVNFDRSEDALGRLTATLASVIPGRYVLEIDGEDLELEVSGISGQTIFLKLPVRDPVQITIKSHEGAILNEDDLLLGTSDSRCRFDKDRGCFLIHPESEDLSIQLRNRSGDLCAHERIVPRSQLEPGASVEVVLDRSHRLEVDFVDREGVRQQFLCLLGVAEASNFLARIQKRLQVFDSEGIEIPEDWRSEYHGGSEFAWFIPVSGYYEIVLSNVDGSETQLRRVHVTGDETIRVAFVVDTSE